MNLVADNHRELVAVQVEGFLSATARDFTISTHRTYKEGIKRFSEWFISSKVKGGLVEHLLEYKRNLKRSYTSANTINGHLSTVRAFISYLYEHKQIPEDLSRELKNIKTSDGHNRIALDKYQIHDLIETINKNRNNRNGERDRLLIILTLSNGLRVNEIANINIDDISGKENDKVIYLLRKGYSDKSCFTILNPKVWSEIRTYIGLRTEGALFTNEQGTNLCSDSVGRIIRNHFRKANITDKRISPHSLRHTFAKLCIEQGVEAIDLMTSLNHKSLDTTMIYLKSLNRHTRSAEKKLKIEF